MTEATTGNNLQSVVDLSVEIAGLRLANPVLTASGTFGYGEEYASLVDLEELGGIVVKAVTLHPRPGNPPPRMVEVAGGILSSCGLQNVGVECFLREKLPYLHQFRVPVIVNVAGESVDEFVVLTERLNEGEGISALELNVSCPNVRNGGMTFGIDPSIVYGIVAAVKSVSRYPVICKLTPNVTDIVRIALSAEEAGADAVSLINAPLGMAIDVQTRRPKLGNVTGGITGPAIKPLAVRMVWQVAQAVRIPVIGVGGITTATDALEFIIAGATAIQVGTANFFRPNAMPEIIQGLRNYLVEQRCQSLRDLRGSLVIN
ncbi:MAG: dihydroorotate dehydrogenase [Pseudomonadota bacterium]|nr:dihydroorotate dehydrogenase [Pseudomonadota bacterium]